jgi:hypothetical protein
VREVAGVAKGVAKGFDKVGPFQTVQGVNNSVQSVAEHTW